MQMPILFDEVVSGIAASIVTFIAISVMRIARQRGRFGPIAGKYVVASLEMERLADGIVEVAYRGGKTLSTRYSSDEAGSLEDWEGTIVMNEDISNYGAGTYQYKRRPDCGIHQIQLSPNDGAIFVRGERTSDLKNAVFAFLWFPLKRWNRMQRRNSNRH